MHSRQSVPLMVQALVKILDDVSNDDIRSLEIPTGVPLVYELDDSMKALRHCHVGYSRSSISCLVVFACLCCTICCA